MKVIHLLNSVSDSDGVSMHVLQLTKLLSANGVTCRIVAGKIISARKFEREGITPLEMPEFLHARRSVATMSAAVSKCYGLLRDSGAKIIHSHSHYAANIAWYASRLAGTSTVQTVHGIIPEGGWLGHFKAKRFICVSETCAEHLIGRGISKDRIHLIRQGVAHSAAPKAKFTEDEIRVSCISRLEHEKGVDLFFEAALDITGKLPGFRFTIAGSGSLEEKILRTLSGTKKSIEFIGEAEDPFAVLDMTDIAVFPGRIPNEGFPMTIAEAGIAGCLVISSRFDSLKYVFDEKLDGHEFELGDLQGLKRKIIHSAQNKEESAERARHFCNKAKRLFDADKFCKKHMDVYEKIL
ncbi:MAG: glycosyltransferase family 4 protein [Ignavibacteria bacterium]|nr:glycosyltransferase family 4 protein [Ignavibacteria bacterium]